MKCKIRAGVFIMDQRDPTGVVIIPRVDCFCLLKHSGRSVKVFLASPLPPHSEIRYVHSPSLIPYNIPSIRENMDRIGVALSKVGRGS